MGDGSINNHCMFYLTRYGDPESHSEDNENEHDNNNYMDRSKDKGNEDYLRKLGEK